MKLLNQNKKKAILAVIALIAVLGVGTTLAWVVWNLRVSNDLTAHITEISVEENFKQNSEPVGQVKKEVAFKNTGNSSVFLRIAYTEYWEAAGKNENKLLSNVLDGADIAVKNWNGGDGKPDTGLWYDAGDGWYYYKSILPAGGKTGNILNSVTFPNGGTISRYQEEKYKDYEDAAYHLYFRAEVVQASDGSGTLNSADVNKKATSRVFGIEAAVDNGGNVMWQKQ